MCQLLCYLGFWKMRFYYAGFCFVLFCLNCGKIYCWCCSAPKLCLTLCDPMDCSPPNSSVPGILQARILEWAAISFTRGVFPTQESNLHILLGRWILYHWATRETLWYNIPNMKFTISAILSIQLSGVKYIHTVVQPSPISISTTLSSPQH